MLRISHKKAAALYTKVNSVFRQSSLLKVCVLGISFSFGLPDTVYAQGQTGLEEIIVTAQRREENLQSAPVSVVAVTADRLSELGVTDPSGLADFIPNLSIGDGTGRGSGGTSISIRGVNEARVSPVLDPAVGIYIDDVYYGRPQTAFLKLIDVQQIEVLRGPQGTLFGKNSTGGALRYTTIKPEFDASTAYVDVTLGDYSRFDVRAAYNLPLSDNFAMRLAAGTLNRDGYIEQLTGEDALGDVGANFLSVKLRWAPNSRTDINLGLDYSKNDTDDGAIKLIDYYRFNNTFDVSAGGPSASGPRASASAAWNAHWGSTSRAYAPVIPVDLYKVGGQGRETSNESESFGLSMAVSYELTDQITLKSITGYREVDELTVRDPDDQASAYTFFDDILDEGVDFFSQELQLSGLSFDQHLNWVAGLYYSKEEPFKRDIEDRDGRSVAAHGALLLNDIGEQKTTSIGVYAQGTYDFTEQLALTVGVRWTEDDKQFTVSQVAKFDSALAFDSQLRGLQPLSVRRYSGCNPVSNSLCISQAAISGGNTFSTVTPRFALEYQWHDDLMTYASASKGFKSGGTNDSVADINTPFEPEELYSYELGLRSEFMQNRARLNLTYFYLDYKDKQITVAGFVGCTNRCTTNAGNASISGIELESLFAVTDSLQLHANIGTLDAQWKSILPGAGVTLETDFGRAPELSYNLGARYNIDVNGGAGIVFTVDYSYTDQQESSPQDSTTITVPEYDLVTARVKYISDDDRWQASLFCTNCLGEKYITGGATWAGSTDNTPFGFKPASHNAFVNGDVSPIRGVAPGIAFVNVGAPRIVGINFRYNY